VRAAIFAHDSFEATDNRSIPKVRITGSPVSCDTRVRRLSFETYVLMRALFSIFLALGLCVGSLQAGPVRTARNVAKNAAVTAENVAHSVVKGTRRAVRTVVYTFTP
jgi:hypothetical protein